MTATTTRRLPERVLRGARASEREGAQRWWRGLTGAERAELVLMWSPRWCQARHLLERQASGGWTWHTLETEPFDEGVALPEEVEEEAAREALSALYWRLVERGDIRVKPRRFHVGCTQHRAARACWERGAIPARFACPLERRACPMRQIIAAAQARGPLRLRGAEGWSPGRAVGVWVVAGQAEAAVEVGA